MKKKWITAALCFAFMMFGMSISAWANTQLQEIKAYLNGELKIRMDGQIVQLKDANGKSVLPISYQGTTYLPVRAVSQLLDVDVSYNAQRKEVVIGEGSQTGNPSTPAQPAQPTPPAQPQPSPAVPDDTVKLVSWSDKAENGKLEVTASVQNTASSGKTVGIVATGYDKNGKAVETQGTSGFVVGGHVRNFNVSLNAVDVIDSVKVELTGYRQQVELISYADRLHQGKLEVTGVVENGNEKGATTGIVVTAYDKNGKAIETKGTSGFVVGEHVRNFKVSLNAASQIARIEVKATGFADAVQVLSEASRVDNGKLVVEAVLENGYEKGKTLGIVVTGYDKNGKAVETKGSSGFVVGEHVRNFSVSLSSASNIDKVNIQITEED